MRSDGIQNGGQSAHFQRVMRRNGAMEFIIHGRRQTRMASRLTGDSIAQDLQLFGEAVPGQITGQLHTASTSSFTKCRRNIEGPLPSSKWQTTASRTFLCSPSK